MATTQLEIRDVYKKCIARFQLKPAAHTLIHKIVANDDEGAAYEEAIRTDRFYTTRVFEVSAEALKKSVPATIGHAAVLLGKELVRDFILGHELRRLANPHADTQAEEMKKYRDLVKRAIQGEDLCERLGDEQEGLGYAIGYLYDSFEQWAASDPKLAHVPEFIENTWRHGQRTGSLAYGLSHHPSLSINLKRWSLPAGILHDIGRLALACAYPEPYKEILKKIAGAKEQHPSNDAYLADLEKEAFGIEHAQVGSLLCFGVGFLSELEEIVDFHHEINAIKSRDADLYLLGAVLNISDRVAMLYENTSKMELGEIKKIMEPYQAAIPLRSDEIQALAVALRSKGAFL